MKRSREEPWWRRPGPLLALSLVSALSFLMAWSLLAASDVIPRRALRSPLDVVMAAKSLSGHPYAGATLWMHLATSLARFLCGFLLAVATGVSMGLVMGRFPVFRFAVAPFFEPLDLSHRWPGSPLLHSGLAQESVGRF